MFLNMKKEKRPIPNAMHNKITFRIKNIAEADKPIILQIAVKYKKNW